MKKEKDEGNGTKEVDCDEDEGEGEGAGKARLLALSPCEPIRRCRGLAPSWIYNLGASF